MKDIGPILQDLRVIVRHSSKLVMDEVLERYISLNSIKDLGKPEICVFCGSQANLTKEHVLPRWTFEKCTTKFFTTDINGYNQTYNKTIIPACPICNNNWLSEIEKYIIALFRDKDLNVKFFDKDEIYNIIRWLEIIDYKFQILDVRRTIKKSKAGVYIPFLTNIPLTVMRENIGYSPSKAMAQIRHSRKWITVKSKLKNGNSLVVFKTKNKDFHFFHHLNDYVYLELPEYKIALFYFYSRTFENNKKAHHEAMKIISTVY